MLTWIIKIWLRYLYPVWNAIPAWVESWGYSKSVGRDTQAILRALAPDVRAISAYMRGSGFEWTSDPLGGLLDFRSRAWVTCARKRGDCDDWAHLWCQLLKYSGKVEGLYNKKRGGGGHAMAIFSLNGKCHLLSNLNVRATVAEYEKDRLLTHFYGDDTSLSVLY